jgi:hypothetical protein
MVGIMFSKSDHSWFIVISDNDFFSFIWKQICMDNKHRLKSRGCLRISKMGTIGDSNEQTQRLLACSNPQMSIV